MNNSFKLLPYFLIAIICILIAQNSLSQNTPIGKAVYEDSRIINYQHQNRLFTFYFSGQTYLFHYEVNGFDSNIITRLFQIRNEKLQDSTKIDAMTKQLYSEMENNNYSPITGNIHSKIVNLRWVEPYTKTEYCITDSLPEMKWQILDDTATIQGILTQKAFGTSIGNQYEAWFAPTIPVSTAL